MFEAWGRALSRRRRLTLAITLLFVVFAGLWGTGVFGKLSSGDNFTPPASQSQREANLAEQVFGRSDADVVVLYHSATMTVADPGRHPVGGQAGRDQVVLDRVVGLVPRGVVGPGELEHRVGGVPVGAHQAG